MHIPAPLSTVRSSPPDDSMSRQKQWSASAAFPTPILEIYPTAIGDQIIVAGGIANVRPLIAHATDQTLFWDLSDGPTSGATDRACRNRGIIPIWSRLPEEYWRSADPPRRTPKAPAITIMSSRLGCVLKLLVVEDVG
jgi:hypothetical protein